MNIKTRLIILNSIGLIFLGSCSKNIPSTSTSSPSSSPVEVVQSPSVSPETKQSQASKGGQVVESSGYHLEFVSEVENNGTHLDFYLQKSDNHEAISNAKVTAQIQLPDGTQKSLHLPYDAGGKHYAALLPEKASGEYNIAILSDISGEKVNGRFTFKR
ncbi:hypothetical protein [Chlorogloea sp. CCALA 695]|uniref:hypothetical protein n=1 Tax=Chlorogloea sp. CCALA 695 TaxID=2107693 RepID=UPI000D07D793|nr:hypothetical protein [Chlorogloea sp. CCALA 695]PSB32505.1 hypothetical protein C7B70_09690 [Chlorogloea sp. CCALA 695]